MHSIIVSEDTPIEALLGVVEAEITKSQAIYVLLSFQDSTTAATRQKVIATIKKYFDIFLVLKIDKPVQQQGLEEFFSYGVHGVYFGEGTYGEELLGFAKELFTANWVFTGPKLALLDKDPGAYSLTDKIKKKMLLETLNFRQKLMVKNVEDSYMSSGL